MTQHFLLSSVARTLSVSDVAAMTDDQAYDVFARLRWAATDGKPCCVRCSSENVYSYRSRRIYKCSACKKQFSLTTGTILASRKLPLKTLLLAIALFANGVKGCSALNLSRDLKVTYSTAFVLAHKLREAMGLHLDLDNPVDAASVGMRLYRSRKGVHHHMSAQHLPGYANEMCWREQRRRVSNGQQAVEIASAAIRSPVSRKWAGFWQSYPPLSAV